MPPRLCVLQDVPKGQTSMLRVVVRAAVQLVIKPPQLRNCAVRFGTWLLLPINESATSTSLTSRITPFECVWITRKSVQQQ